MTGENRSVDRWDMLPAIAKARLEQVNQEMQRPLSIARLEVN